MTELLDGIQLGELRGRRQKRISAVAVRPLQEADLAVLAQGDRARTPVVTLKRLKERHHLIARLVAGGKTNTEISLVSGMDSARISTLRGDPSFADLVNDYRKIEAGIAAEITERMTMLSLTAVEELQARMEDSEEPLPVTSLLEIAKFGTDRTGYGPVTKQMNTNVNVDLSGRLAAARKRAPLLAVADQSITDAEFTEVPGSLSVSERTGTDD